MWSVLLEIISKTIYQVLYSGEEPLPALAAST
jgi:hypothetical protein